MTVEKTYLLTAPTDCDNPFGRAIMSSDLIAGLKKINPQIWADTSYSPGIWWPGKSVGGTTLWVGVAGFKECSKKITGYVPGPIPEFTQLGPNGVVITKGWRAIFSKVIRSGAASAVAIENRFNVTLDTKKEEGVCQLCRRGGKVVRSKGKDGMCDVHAHAQKAAEKARQLKRDLLYMRRKLGCQPSPSRATS